MALRLFGPMTIALPLGLFWSLCSSGASGECEKVDGYRGIWYCNQPTKDEYVYKYSGGLGTYCMKHIPMAVYAPEVNKTFFAYGGTDAGNTTLLEMVSCYDHNTGAVPKPTVLMDKKTTDAHDNPVMALDDQGYVWVFASSHGTSRPSYIFKSKKPYDVDDFDQVVQTNFSYPQPWHIKSKGFIFLHTRYQPGRALYVMTSPDGIVWSEGKCLAYIGEGHYQVSWPRGNKIGTAFDQHPKGKGLNFRTNLYYIETEDMGTTWRTIRKETVEIPLTSVENPALVHDYASEGLLVYVKDLNWDKDGRPIILFVTSKGWEPGPKNGPYMWRVAHWTGDAWEINGVTESDNNYDSGSLYVEADGAWRIIAPTESGPQAFNPGGEVAVWTSQDSGKTWERVRIVTRDSPYNHTHVRRPLNAHPDFYAFWADGDCRRPSESHLYFCNKDGDRVMRLPFAMESASVAPARAGLSQTPGNKP